MKKNLLICCAVLYLTGCGNEQMHDEKYAAQPILFSDVKISDDFWSKRIETNRTVTIPYDLQKCEETGRINNFAVAGGLKEGKFEGIRYNDSDVYKVMEGIAYSIKSHPDSALENYMDNLISFITAAQEDDGYLYTQRTIDSTKMEKNAGAKRWSYLHHSHELYNVGHMYEAAVAWFDATGKRNLLDVATKNADFLLTVFGPDKNHGVPGHQEIEIGLVKLFRVTGKKAYLDLAKFFLDQRGVDDTRELYGDYCQDHIPVVQQTEAVGHAVRALYMYSGMADVASKTGDSSYVKAIDRIWENMVNKRIYITGGVGARRHGEAFGDDYELPNASAYNETCAAIANMMWNHRLFLLHEDAKYIDVLERTLYNGFLAGVSLEGNLFFYPNPLESDGVDKFNQGAAERQPWFNCSCCPVNVVRTMPAIPGYIYAHNEDAVFVNLFIGSEAKLQVQGTSVTLQQQTGLPWKGDVSITVSPEKELLFALKIRIPGWATEQPVPGDLYTYLSENPDPISLAVNGEPVNTTIEKGYVTLEQSWKKGDVIALTLPVRVRRVIANINVADNAGKVSLERGPVVYCIEGFDNDDTVLGTRLADGAQLNTQFNAEKLGGIIEIRGQALAPNGKKTVLTAIPYYAWNHRGANEMTVWIDRK
ncbi:MAG: glycoside hydrolase family 127 protein [Calditrichaeota bacterium]|nr:MAG: glycoside hydrolase family 127 protein [Calditrichota bacterium]